MRTILSAITSLEVKVNQAGGLRGVAERKMADLSYEAPDSSGPRAKEKNEGPREVERRKKKIKEAGGGELSKKDISRKQRKTVFKTEGKKMKSPSGKVHKGVQSSVDMSPGWRRQAAFLTLNHSLGSEGTGGKKTGGKNRRRRAICRPN